MRIQQNAHPALTVLGAIILSSSLWSAHSQPAPVPKAAHHVLDLTVNKPESVGFSSERLERLHTLMQQAVDQKQIAGIVTILARHGKVVDYRTYG